MSSTYIWQRNRSMLHTFMINWLDEDDFASDNKMIYCRYILFKYPRTSGTVQHSVGRNVEESSFSCIRQIANLLRNTLLMDLSGDLAIISLNRHTIRILKTDICSVSIHSHRMTTCSLFIDSWFIRYLHILIHWDCDGNIWFFIKFKSDYK